MNQQWTDARPTLPGVYWVWQPQDRWPCRGEVRAVEVHPKNTWGDPYVESSELEAQVPFMDYADPVKSDTWDGARWMGPLDRPESPMSAFGSCGPTARMKPHGC